MATGGTIPANRTQTVTFYNTCGVVDKDKNVYLSPRFTASAIGKKVNVAYLQALEAVCPPSSAYKDIGISGWSPQDKTLVVRGNIDDFRLVTEEGACLNYLIVTRQVTKGLVTKAYYYGFFITGVEQSGGSSIRLTLEPDDFTNVFYLHNEYVMTNIGYEPFNGRMKNCHVNRQHYDRISVTSHYTVWFHFYEVPAGISLAIGQPISFNSGLYPIQLEGVVEDYNDSHYDLDEELVIKVKFDTKVPEDVEGQDWCQIIYGGNTYDCLQSRGAKWNVVIDSMTPTNLKIFLNQEESFKFKYQYRDKKVPVYFASIFSDEEMQTINNTLSFSNLSALLKEKVIKASMQYLVIEMKSDDKLGYFKFLADNSEPFYYKSYPKNYIEGFSRTSPIVFVPFFNVPSVLKKYENDILAFDFYFLIKGATAESKASSASDVYKGLNINALADFVLSTYIVNDIGIPDNFINFDLANHKVRLISNNSYDERDKYFSDFSSNDLYVFALQDNSQAEGIPPHRGIVYKFTNESLFPENKPYGAEVDANVYTVFMLSGYNSREITINLSESVSISLVSNYYDPVIEAEPYSFYSFSFMSYELPFNKTRYYEESIIIMNYYVSVNGAVKLSYIPTYQVEGKKYLYYNEGLVFTLPSNLPLVSDAYASYYYQNQAQMKNQFAVNDYNRGVDLAQHFFLSGPNAVGQSAFKRGGYGAIAETINQFSQMADEAIDWAQSNKVIEMNQKAKLADVGAKPDVVKQTGSDSFFDLTTRENRPFINHYTIDSESYNSIAKFLERFGYQINLYDTLHVMDRVGWNYIRTNSFDWNPDYDIMVEQEENLIKIFSKGVTLLHNKAYLTSGHNYETILDS